MTPFFVTFIEKYVRFDPFGAVFIYICLQMVCKFTNNTNMITAKFYLDIRNQKKDGTYSIKINITRYRKVIFINTGFSSTKENWEGNQFSSHEPNFRAKNSRLRDMFNKVERIIYELEETGEGNSITEKQLKTIIGRRLFGGKEQLNVFINVLDKFLETKVKQGTRKVYIETRKKILSFDPDATFETITIDWLTRFDNEMYKKGLKTNYRGIQLRNIRAVFNYAIDNEITTLYPFRRFKIKKEETAKRSLTLDELRNLRDCPVEDYQEKYRDMFMLMFYLMGINAVDLFSLPPLKGDRITYHRAKTNKLYDIKVEPEARAIIKKYKGDKYMLNVLDGYKDYKDCLHWMNAGLKKIGNMKRVGRGGKKEIEPYFPELSSYWSRHTWATLAASLDIPKETIAAALGHSSNSVTDIYIKFDKSKVDKANRAVIDYVLYGKTGE